VRAHLVRRRKRILVDDVGGRRVTEREGVEMEPLLREVLLSEPEIVAWLELQEVEDVDESPGAAR